MHVSTEWTLPASRPAADGRITREDVIAEIKAAMQGGGGRPRPAQAAAGSLLELLPWPKVDFARVGPDDSRPLSRIKKISGANLSRNSVVIPHVTNFDKPTSPISRPSAARSHAEKREERMHPRPCWPS